MSNIIKELSIVFGAALTDTVANIFKPVHNAKVILGLEQEPSIADKIELHKRRLSMTLASEEESNIADGFENHKNQPNTQSSRFRKVAARR